MDMVFLLLGIAGLLGLIGLIALIWSLNNRQYDDPELEALRIFDEEDGPLE
jgi:cbb3-type cytochrome oxidase maturation protein